MLTASAATGTGWTGVGYIIVVEGTNVYGAEMGNGSGTTRPTGMEVGVGDGVNVGAGVGVEAGVNVGAGVGDAPGTESGVRKRSGKPVTVGGSSIAAARTETLVGSAGGESFTMAAGGGVSVMDDAIAVMAGGFVNRGKPTTLPIIVISRNNIQNEGHPVNDCCGSRRCRV